MECIPIFIKWNCANMAKQQKFYLEACDWNDTQKSEDSKQEAEKGKTRKWMKTWVPSKMPHWVQLAGKRQQKMNDMQSMIKLVYSTGAQFYKGTHTIQVITKMISGKRQPPLYNWTQLTSCQSNLEMSILFVK